MRVVIDTNVFVESISRTSPYHSLFTNLTKGNFLICISNSILLEYEEVLYSLHRQENADRLMDFLNVSPFVIPVSPNKYYNLIVADPDDNKFTDCAIAANADFIITSDNHFNILKMLDLPKIVGIHPREFINRYL